MPTNTNVTNLKINTLTKAQYDTAVQGGVIGANEISIITDLEDSIQVSSMPVAGAGEEGKIYQFVGTTDANYTNGYFYKCVLSLTPSTITSATQTTGSGLSNITVDAAVYTAKFYSVANRLPDADNVNFTYSSSSDSWAVSGYHMSATGQTSDWGITYTGTPSDGDVINVVSTGGAVGYAWSQLNVQPAGSSLPSQTGNSGKFLTTDGTDASWGSINALQNTFDTTKHQSLKVTYTSQGSGDSGVVISDINVSTAGVAIGTGISQSNALGTGVVIGSGARANATIGNDSGVVIGSNAQSTAGIAIGTSAIAGKYCLAIGFNAQTTVANNFQGAIQIGAYNYTNTDANTVKIANANGNFEIMSADGTIPTDRLTKVNTAVTIAVADWNGGTTVTKTVNGITATGVVFVNPDPTNQSAYTSAGILCTAQAANSLTFTCTTTPTSAIGITVIML